MAVLNLAGQRALAVDLLLNRLLWPVPLVRWRAARGLRDLMEDPTTRVRTTDALLVALKSAALESDACTILTVLLMVRNDAVPDLLTVRDHLLQPSILAEIILQEIYGTVAGTDWWRGHSGPPFLGFQASSYFEEHQTHHVPVVLSTNMSALEGKSGLPFMRQWAFEWQQLCDRTDARFTEFPYYFCDFGEARDGIIGQFSPRQSELYRSAYLRSFSIAVSEWGFSQREAGYYVSELLPSIRGLFEFDPVGRPEWLRDLPERCAANPDDMESIARSLIGAIPDKEKALISLHVPLDATVERFADLTLTAHLVTPDFVPHGGFLPLPTTLVMAHDGFALDQSRDETPMERVQESGLRGDALPVCSALLPIPYGQWHGHLHSTGIPLPNSYLLPDASVIRSARNSVWIQCGTATVSTSQYWLDHWSPNYPLDGGTTRCGVWSTIDRAVLGERASMLDRKLAWSVRLQIWRREEAHGPYQRTELTLFLSD